MYKWVQKFFFKGTFEEKYQITQNLTVWKTSGSKYLAVVKVRAGGHYFTPLSEVELMKLRSAADQILAQNGSNKQ